MPMNDNPPIPDPTVLTTEQLLRTVSAERDYVDGKIGVLNERLNGMDRATELLSETVHQVPTALSEGILHLRELSDEKFVSISTQFKERDTRSERESRDNKVAVDAAFAAQKEAASEQNKSNTLAITKSELSTTETINKLGDLFRTTNDGIITQVTDLKERISRMESTKQGAEQTNSIWIAVGAVIVSIVSVAVAALSVATR